MRKKIVFGMAIISLVAIIVLCQKAGVRLKETFRESEETNSGAKVMTYECGMRFLMDYLQGDRYFKIHRDGQNLDRARTQLTLVADMERKMQQMQDIVRKAAG